MAELKSDAKVMLPKTLQNAAVILAEEPCWPALEALQIVEWFAAHGYEVVGVEGYQSKEGKALFVASSDYSPRTDDKVTSDSVARYAHKASVFIAKLSRKRDIFFNIAGASGFVDVNNDIAASSLPIYTCVQLKTDKYRYQGASCFNVGYIIEVYPNNKYEVEFSDLNGITTAQIVADGNELELAPPTFAAPKPNPNAPRINAQLLKEHKP